MAAIKQLKIGSTNYDIKALNASNNNTADFVVRDFKYGTTNPTGGRPDKFIYNITQIR